MKDKLLDNTIAKLSGSLTPAQLYELRKTLEQELSGFEVVVDLAKRRELNRLMKNCLIVSFRQSE